MSIVSLNPSDEKSVSYAITRFLSDFAVAWLIRKCGGAKLKGVPSFVLFSYVLTNAFRMGSFYMQSRMASFATPFSKNTYYRFFVNPHMNWLRFTTLLAERIIRRHLRPLTSDARDDCFVIDDSLYERAGFKRTELVSRVFDHVSGRFKKGFRLLTLGWTDGCTFLPVNFSMLASSKEQNVLGPCNSFDRRSLCGKRRIMARRKGTCVMLELLREALKAGYRAKYVLFDSWFSNPKQILDVHALQLDVIAMVKRSPTIRYCFQGKQRSLKDIFAHSKKRRGRSRYLLSVPVKVGSESKGQHPVDARIVCVRNRNNRKDWIALICTDMALREEDIIRIYGKRWDIEVFFKTCKSNLLLRKEYHGLSYDGLTAHVSMVFVRYMLLAVLKRDEEDARTIGELFFLTVSEVADMTYQESLLILLAAMLTSMQKTFQLSEEQIEAFYIGFAHKLPAPMQHLLRIS